MNGNEKNQKNSDGNRRWTDQYDNRRTQRIGELSEWAKKDEITKRRIMRIQQVSIAFVSNKRPWRSFRTDFPKGLIVFGGIPTY